MSRIPAFALFFVAMSAHAVDFKINNSINQKDQKVLRDTLNEVMAKMPASFKNKLPATININLKTFQGSETIPDVCSATTNVKFRYGEYRHINKTLTLNKAVTNVLAKGASGSQKISCQHKSIYNQAVATIIHELTHAYDFNSGIPSESAEFKNIAGFRKFFFSNKKNNVDPMRSMDVYEYENPKESFAVNMEYFVMDEEYACRRPVMFEYYRKHFGADPFPGRSCNVNYNVMLATQAGLVSYNVDPTRVYRIEYLLAEKGNDAASGFGHSMFRIVMCAPDHVNPLTGANVNATPFGKKCLEDKLFHIVASYRANNEGGSLDYMKGIFGGYPSMLFMMSLGDVIEEYNRAQMRDMTAYPLKLTGREKVGFLNRLLEEHWDYRGSYKFVTNNCAVESLKTVNGVLNERGTPAKKGVLPTLTPKAILNVFAETGIVDLNDPEKVVFSSGRENLLTAHSVTYGKASKKNDEKTFTNFVLNSTPDNRINVFKDTLKDSSAPKAMRESLLKAKHDIIKIASFSVIEQQVFRSKTDILKKKLADYTSDEKNFKNNPEVFKMMAKAKTNSVDIGQLAKKGYGIPQASEIEVTFDETIAAEDAERMFELSKNILSDIFPTEFNEMNEIAENLKFMNDFGLKIRREYRKSFEKYFMDSLITLSKSTQGRRLLSETLTQGTQKLRATLSDELVTKTEITDEKIYKLIQNLGM